MDLRILIKSLLSDEKPISGQTVLSEVYHDEPILKTAAQVANETPPKYLQMRRIANSCAGGFSEAAIFYKQGKFMEDFEDDYTYHGEFSRYYPTYRSMNTLQLRGYFSWRTKVRKGVVEETLLSFAFVYIYELLNLIGVHSPEEGYYALKSFWEAYKTIDDAVSPCLKRWLRDFVVYYNLDSRLLDDLPEVRFDKCLLILQNCREHDADAVFEAQNSLSSYNVENSRFYKQYPDDLKAVFHAVLKALAEHYEKTGKGGGICPKFFGAVLTEVCRMFQSAVFYEPKRHEDTIYKINGIDTFVCKKGVWTRERFMCYKNKSQKIGSLMRTVDCLMRRAYNFNSLLKEEATTKLILNTVQKEIERFLEDKRKSALPIIEIDTSKLQGIRRESLETQDKLLVEEEPQEPVLEAEPLMEDCTALNAAERLFLRRLLFGEAYDAAVRESGMLLSVLVDAINEKLFERFGDTVVVFDGEKPSPLPDYIDELKGIITDEGT